MITNFKIFEINRPSGEKEFIYVNNNYKVVNINKLIQVCSDYNSGMPATFDGKNWIQEIELIREMILNKKILFRCNYCYGPDIFSNHQVFDKCVDVKYENPEYLDSDILVKMKNDPNVWHTLFIVSDENKRIRIYDYEIGPLESELEMFLNSKKFNI